MASAAIEQCNSKKHSSVELVRQGLLCKGKLRAPTNEVKTRHLKSVVSTKRDRALDNYSNFHIPHNVVVQHSGDFVVSHSPCHMLNMFNFYFFTVTFLVLLNNCNFRNMSRCSAAWQRYISTRNFSSRHTADCSTLSCYAKPFRSFSALGLNAWNLLRKSTTFFFTFLPDTKKTMVSSLTWINRVRRQRAIFLFRRLTHGVSSVPTII